MYAFDRQYKKECRRIILDLDVGTDDAYALLVLLHAEKTGLVKIEAIVCSMGNASVNNVCKNVVRLLEVLKRTDIPVYKGVPNAIIPSETQIQQFHGFDGFGDILHEKEPDLSIIRSEVAVLAMRDIIVKNPGEITLVAVGPLTNIALAMKVFEDVAPNVKDMYIMGGNTAATGNIAKHNTAEYNFFIDPEAAYIVLNTTKCPITILTWETCISTQITFDWRFSVLGAKKTPFMQLMNRAERNLHGDTPRDPTWYPCDALLAIAMLYPDSIERQTRHNATVELHGCKTRGQTVLDHVEGTEPNLNVVEKINDEFVKITLMKAVEGMRDE